MGFQPRQPGETSKKIVGDVMSAFGYLRRQKISNAALGTANFVHANITLTTAIQQITTAITNPDVPRILSITGTKAGGALTGNVIITGTNIRGEAITETIAITADTEVFGLKAFKTVTNIQVPVRATAGDVVSIGVGDALGLDRCMAGDEVLLATMGGAFEATRPTVVADVDEVEKNTANPNTALDGSADLVIVFVSTEKTNKIGSTT